MSRLKKSAKVGAVACALIGGFEGVRLNAYPDPATKGHPWTICYGETQGVKKGDRRTMEQCKAGLLNTADVHADQMERCIKRPMPDGVYIAFASFTYNVGPGAFCKSSVARLYNEGRTREACDFLLKYNRAAGVVFPGLTKRRIDERAWCLRGDLG